MKFSPSQGTAVVSDRSILLRRDRAAAPALRAVFPSLAQLRIELRFDGSGGTLPVPQTHVLHPPARAFFVFPCPYADCDGQFDLATAVSAALGAPALRSDGHLECAGQRAGGRASRRPCRLSLHYSITATRTSA
jgi:hypothetical protein